MSIKYSTQEIQAAFAKSRDEVILLPFRGELRLDAGIDGRHVGLIASLGGGGAGEVPRPHGCVAQDDGKRPARIVEVDENDLWIAATALVHGAVVVSRDQFLRKVPWLQTDDWSI
jgi:hypothetical protein